MGKPRDTSPLPSYEVEDIKKWRFNKKKNRREFFIKWVDYPESENTWEPESNLHCPKKIRNFKRRLSKRERSYLNSTDPLRLSGFQRNAELVKIVNIDGPHKSDDEDSSKLDKQKFYIIAKFRDSDTLEEMQWRHFFDYKPDALFSIFEDRLFNRRTEQSDSD